MRLHLMIWSNLFETWIWYVQILKGQSANLWFWDNLGRGSRLEFSKLKRVTFWSKRSQLGIFCTFFFASPSRRLSHRWFPEWPFGPKGRPSRKTMSKTKSMTQIVFANGPKGNVLVQNIVPAEYRKGPSLIEKVAPAEYQKGRSPHKTSKT